MKLRSCIALIAVAVALLLPTQVTWAQSSCTITGVVYTPDGSTINNGTITFAPAGQVPQIIGGQAIFPKFVSTTTDGSGNLIPISLLQGAAMNVTICQAGGSACSALVYVSVPAESAVSFALLLANAQISAGAVSLEGDATGTIGDNVVNTVLGGKVPLVGAPVPHTLSVVSNATTLIASSTTEPLIDREYITLPSGGVTATSPAASAMANAQEFEVEVTQPSGTNSYTFSVAGGAGVTLDTSRAGVPGGGQCVAPTSGSGAPAYLDEIWWWTAANSTLSLESCTYTNVPPAVAISGTPTTGHCGEWASSTSLEDSGSACGGSGTVTGVTGTAPIVSSGGTTPAISLATSGVSAGSYTNASITVGANGLLTSASNGGSGTISTPATDNIGATTTFPSLSGASFNSAFGVSAMTALIGGQNNTAVGYESLQEDTSGSSNSALGAGTLETNTTDSDDTAMGFRALNAANASGIGLNTAFGEDAGRLVTTGSSNIFLGTEGNITTGSNNILIGNSLANTVAGSSNQLDIGDFLYGSDSAGGQIFLNGIFDAIDGSQAGANPPAPGTVNPSGTAHGIACSEGTSPTIATGEDGINCNSTSHRMSLVNNGVAMGSVGALFAKTTVSVTAPTAVGCTDGTVAVTSSTTSMAVLASPQSNPNGSSGAVTWSAYVSTAGTVDVRVCNLVVETSPPATTYNVQVYE
ncbi:MAG: hypothetical protein WBQ34_10145 [Candidatus Acidiferrales bacterium]